MNRKSTFRRPNPVAPYQALMAETEQLIQDQISALHLAQPAAWQPPASLGGGAAGPALLQSVLQHGIGTAAAALEALARTPRRFAETRAGHADAIDVIDVAAREVSGNPGSRKEA